MNPIINDMKQLKNFIKWARKMGVSDIYMHGISISFHPHNKVTPTSVKIASAVEATKPKTGLGGIYDDEDLYRSI